MLSEVSQIFRKDKYCMSSYKVSKIGKFIEIENTIEVTRGWEGATDNGELFFNRYRVSI